MRITANSQEPQKTCKYHFIHFLFFLFCRTVMLWKVCLCVCDWRTAESELLRSRGQSTNVRIIIVLMCARVCVRWAREVVSEVGRADILLTFTDTLWLTGRSDSDRSWGCRTLHTHAKIKIYFCAYCTEVCCKSKKKKKSVLPGPFQVHSLEFICF